MTLGKEGLEKCKIIQANISEVHMEETIEMTILEEVEVGLGNDNIVIILDGMIEAIVVHQDQI